MGVGQTLGYKVLDTMAWRFIRTLLTAVYRPLIAALYDKHAVDPNEGSFDVDVCTFSAPSITLLSGIIACVNYSRNIMFYACQTR